MAKKGMLSDVVIIATGTDDTTMDSIANAYRPFTLLGVIVAFVHCVNPTIFSMHGTESKITIWLVKNGLKDLEQVENPDMDKRMNQQKRLDISKFHYSCWVSLGYYLFIRRKGV